jgi:hypothetical protein
MANAIAWEVGAPLTETEPLEGFGEYAPTGETE